MQLVVIRKADDRGQCVVTFTSLCLCVHVCVCVCVCMSRMENWRMDKIMEFKTCGFIIRCSL